MNRPVRIVFVMDAPAKIKARGDSSLAMMLEAQRRGWEVYYAELPDLWIRDGVATAALTRVEVREDPNDWHTFGERTIEELGAVDCVMMRKDPPFDIQYIFATYVLERAEAAGALVVNRPQTLRDANEKVFISWFPQCAPPTIIARSADVLNEFIQEHGRAVIKPLDRMAGRSVFMTGVDDPNRNVILETLTADNTIFVTAQKYIPEAAKGDKRILLIDGEPVPHGLLRVPSEGDFRGNLSMGASAQATELTDRDRWICSQVAPGLRDRGLIFVGIDVLGDHLTEINVTSPTGIRELDVLCNANVAGLLMDALEERLTKNGQ